VKGLQQGGSFAKQGSGGLLAGLRRGMTTKQRKEKIIGITFPRHAVGKKSRIWKFRTSSAEADWQIGRLGQPANLKSSGVLVDLQKFGNVTVEGMHYEMADTLKFV